MSFDPLDVFERHAYWLMARLRTFAAVHPHWPCALIAVRHATPRGEDVMVGTFAEVEAMLHASKVHDVAAELVGRRDFALDTKTFIVAVVHDMHHAPALVEVPA